VPKNTLLFIFVLICTLFSSMFFPSCRLFFFPPFIIILFYQKPYTFCLWSALLCGLILDLLSFQTRLGLNALAYCLTTILLYGQTRNFFADRLSTLPIMTFFFSFLCTLLQGLLINIFDKEMIFSWTWLVSDLLIMPLLDALFALMVFNVPMLFFRKRPRRGKDYFMERRG